MANAITSPSGNVRALAALALAAVVTASCWGEQNLIASAPAGDHTISTGPSGGLSPLERAAVADTRAEAGDTARVTLAIVATDGTVSELTLPAGEVEAEADRLAADGNTVAVSFGARAEDVASAPDPQLLFAGKEVFGLDDWIRDHPQADGRGIKIAVVDDGVALGRPGLERTTLGTAKIAAVINTAAGWTLPLYPPEHSCHKPARTAAASASWEVDAGEGLPDLEAARVRVPFDLTPCGINPFLRTRPGVCERWSTYFPNASGRLVDGVLTVAALYLELPGDGESAATSAVLVDVDGDGRISAREVFRPISEGGAHLTLPDGAALAFDVHASASLVPAEPGVQGNDVVVCPTPAERTLTVALPQTALDHGEGVAGIAAGHDIAGQGVDGMAPGSQVVDVQFSTMSSTHPYTFAEIARALQTAGRHADIVNLSYSLFFSSPAAQVAMRRVLEAALGPTRALYFFSAGNNGPGRGSMNRALLYPGFGVAVAAYLDPLLAQTTFGSALPLPGVVAYSSRGPGYDGASGALLLSPLAGIVPDTAEGGIRPFSGTSSATPALAGLAARVLSQVRAEGLPVSRELFRRALVDGARPLPDVPFIDQGWGIPRLSEVLARYRALVAAERTPPTVAVSSVHVRDGITQRGIYVRDRIGREAQYSFRLQPVFDGTWSERDRANYSARLEIVPGASWLRAPRAALLGRSTIGLDVAVDWEGLAARGPGEHLSDVRVFELATDASGQPARQLRAIIPVTVLQPSLGRQVEPLDMARGFEEEVQLPPSGIARRFLARPEWASHLVVAAETADPTQRLCGYFSVYNPHGDIPEQVDGRSGTFRQEQAFATTVAGLHELVVVNNRNHVSCAEGQRVRLKARWIQLALTHQGVRINNPPATPPYQVDLLLTTRAPLLIGTLILNRLGESFRVDMLPGARGWEWAGDRALDVGPYAAFGFRFDEGWVRARANLPNLLTPRLIIQTTNAAAPTRVLPLSPSGKLLLAQTGVLPPAERAGVRLALTLFDSGADPLLAPGRIPLVGHGVLPALAGASSTTTNLQLTPLEPRSFAITFPAPLDAVRGKTALCAFQPVDFQVGVPCGSIDIW